MSVFQGVFLWYEPLATGSTLILQLNEKIREKKAKYPVPTGPPMPTVKARSLKSREDIGAARLVKKPGE